MTESDPGEQRLLGVRMSLLRRLLPIGIVVLAVGTIALSIWGIASETEPAWLDTVADGMAWAALAGVFVMVSISRRRGR